jgi:U6 snRNA-associated Sm-like protein LSm6
MSRKQTPSEFLKQIIGRPVVVKLNSGVDYRGFLNYKLSKKKTL